MKLYLVFKSATLHGVHRDKRKAQASIDRLTALGRDTSQYRVEVKEIRKDKVADYFAAALRR